MKTKKQKVHNGIDEKQLIGLKDIIIMILYLFLIYFTICEILKQNNLGMIFISTEIGFTQLGLNLLELFVLFLLGLFVCRVINCIYRIVLRNNKGNKTKN